MKTTQSCILHKYRLTSVRHGWLILRLKGTRSLHISWIVLQRWKNGNCWFQSCVLTLIGTCGEQSSVQKHCGRVGYRGNGQGEIIHCEKNLVSMTEGRMEAAPGSSIRYVLIVYPLSTMEILLWPFQNILLPILGFEFTEICFGHFTCGAASSGYRPNSITTPEVISCTNKTLINMLLLLSIPVYVSEIGAYLAPQLNQKLILCRGFLP